MGEEEIPSELTENSVEETNSVSAPNPEAGRTPKLVGERGGISRKAALAAGAAAAAIGVGAYKLDQSPRHEPKSAVAADVSFDQYGKDGHPAPQVIMQKSQDPGIESITPVPSENPYEYAQQMLYIAANTDPQKVTLNHIAYGLTVVFPPGTVLYHSAIGSKKFMPAKPNPNNDGKADKFEVPPNEYLIWKNPRSIALEYDEQVWYAGNMANDTNTVNRATDVNQNYLISIPQALKDKVQYYSQKGEPVELFDGLVNSDGNLELGDVPTEELSVFQIMDRDEWQKMKTQQDLSTTTNPPIAGR